MSQLRRRCLCMLAVIPALVMAPMVGCQSVGPAFEQNKDTVTMSEPAPNKLSQADASGLWTIASTGPVNQTTLDSKGKLTSLGGGVASREFIMPVEGMPVVLRSGSDVTIDVKKLFSPSSGAPIAEGVKISTSISAPTRAGNEALDRLVTWWTALSADQRDVAIKQIEASEAISQNLKDLLVPFLSALGG